MLVPERRTLLYPGGVPYPAIFTFGLELGSD